MPDERKVEAIMAKKSIRDRLLAMAVEEVKRTDPDGYCAGLHCPGKSVCDADCCPGNCKLAD